ncbi:MAG TPA: alpha/beta hydrolase [Caldimonas sp.]|nr:alpha/beta hydrolase [Caldimonas sp.]
MHDIQHRTIQTNGIDMHIAESGSGPLVVMCHGFPESWYSWRHQIRALAEAGFHAVAPDMRGYGRTSAPAAIEQYTLLHLVGDIVGLVDALGGGPAIVAGHDWGAPVAWHAALLRPDIFRGIVALSVPYRPRGSVQPTTVMPKTDDAVFYQLYFQEPGVAERELEADPRRTLHALLFGGSGDAPRGAGGGGIAMVPRNGGFLGRVPPQLPFTPWLTPQDLDYYAGEFVRTGFRGGLNWYRNIDRNWELLAAYKGAKVSVPALYMAGDRDLVVKFPGADQHIANLKSVVPRLARTVMLEGCGHWTQQERAADVNAAMIEFAKAA